MTNPRAGLPRRLLLLAVLVAAGRPLNGGEAQRPSLKEALAQLRDPPPWLESVSVDFDTSKPWNKAWDRIEQLLFTADPADRRKAVKLAYVYQKEGKARDGLPAATYFLAGEYAWALVELQKLAKKDSGAWSRSASCYRHFGEHRKALDALAEALKSLPDPPWASFAEAGILAARGDICAELGDAAKARESYQRAIQRYEGSKLPNDSQLLIRRNVERVEARLELLERSALKSARLKDGTCTGTAFGYSDNILARVTIERGRIADIQLEHKERADLGARRILPERIIAKQGLEVDGVTGATVTSQAIETAVFRALRRAAGM
ncbi:MAG: tetratricopeptide repeat protein [Planctomycetes bacterium]|nr:tetratricopeptide repeat protein [Planctomycetota bacterium]